jgi:hypothetical protein
MSNEIFLFTASQAFGFLALICTVVSMQLKKKRPLMILQTMSEAFIVAQYFTKSAFTGMLLSIVSFIRDIIFTKYEKRRAPLWILLALYLVMTVLTALSWAGPLSFLPYVGSLFFAWSLWYGKVKWIRFGNAVGNSPYLVYTILTGNYVLFAMTLFEVLSSIIGFIRIDLIGEENSKKKKSRNKK